MDGTISVLVIGKNTVENNMDICLAARAFGAANVTFVGKKSPKIDRYFKALNRKWGGSFAVSFTNDWEGYLADKKNYKTIYLTRYGTPISKVEYSLKTYKNILVIVTLSESIKSLYNMSDFNVSISTQPHCAAAAIAVFLHTFYQGRELAMHFENAQLKVVPETRRIHIEKTK